MATAPKVSVVTVVRNAERFIEGAIRSILAQSFTDFEYVIIDDGSTDGTAAVIDRCARDDRRIRPEHRDHAGISKSRNRGLKLCRGIYVAVLDADDLAMPQRLERQVSFMDRNPEIALLGAAELSLDVGQDRVWLVKHPLEDKHIRRSWVYRQVFTHSATMMRRSIVDEVGGYDEDLIRLGEDPDLWARIAERAKVANLAEPLVVRRYHPDQVSRATKIRDLGSRIRIRQRAIRKLGLPHYHYLFLAVPLMSVFPDWIKRFLRRAAGQQAGMEAWPDEINLDEMLGRTDK